MGKKKRQKTKELSVAIAEASATAGETGQQEIIQPQRPRKRGRPRKIVVETKTEEKKVQQPTIEELEASTAAQGTESSTKKDEEQLSTCIRVTNEEERAFEENPLPKGEPSRSRARRKSKPRKSA